MVTTGLAMAQVLPIDLGNYTSLIAEDVRNLIKKYHSLVETNTPNLDEDLADALIMLEVRKVLKNIQDVALEKIIN